MTLVQPTNLQVALVGNNQLDLTWLDNEGGELGYWIERRAQNAILGDLRALPHVPGYTDWSHRIVGGGEIRDVDNLNPSGSGSFFDAVSTPGNADIVFSVGGDIPKTAGWVFSSGEKIVHGYTAPVPIRIIHQTTESNGMIINGDVDMRLVFSHIFFRYEVFTGGGDGTQIGNVEQLLFDHCSFSGGADSITDITVNAQEIGFYRCILGPSTTALEKGLLLYNQNNENASVQNVALIENLWTTISDRAPAWKHGTSFYVVNNLWYDCRTFLAYASANWGPPGIDRTSRHIFQGNRYKYGPYRASDGNAHPRLADPQWAPGGVPTAGAQSQFTLYFDNTEDRGGVIDVLDYEKPFVDGGDYADVNVVFETSRAAVMTGGTGIGTMMPVLQEDSEILASSNVEAHVVANAGAWPGGDPSSGGLREEFDRQTLADVAAGLNGGGLITAPRLTTPRASDTHDLSALTAAGWEQQALDEAVGYRVLDVRLQAYRDAVEGP